jgi:hypothetical protein
MGGMTAVGKETSRWVTPALIGLGLVLVLVLALDTAEILKAATGESNNTELGQGGALKQLGDTANNLASTALPLTIGIAPLVCAGGALAMHFGGTRKAIPIIYGSIGAVVVVLLAKGLAA